MTSREKYIYQMSSKMDQWSNEIHTLSVKINKAKNVNRSECYKQIEALREKHKTAHLQLLTIKQAGENIWNSMKPGIETTQKTIDTAIYSMKLRLK